MDAEVSSEVFERLRTVTFVRLGFVSKDGVTISLLGSLSLGRLHKAICGATMHRITGLPAHYFVMGVRNSEKSYSKRNYVVEPISGGEWWNSSSSGRRKALRTRRRW